MTAPQSTARRRVSECIDMEMRGGRGLSGLNRVIVAAILFSTLLVILETETAIYERHRAFFFWSEAAMMIFFAAEYLARFWSCLENPRYPTRWAYFISPVAVLDLIVLITMALTFCGLDGSLLRLLRLARLLRIAKLGKFSNAMHNIGQAIADRKMELLISLFMAFGLLVVSAAALYLVEGEKQPEAYGSIPRAMWWSVATLTTVGYGDTIPITPLGKILASLTALTGIGLIAIPTGILASAFSAAVRKSDAEKRAAK